MSFKSAWKADNMVEKQGGPWVNSEPWALVDKQLENSKMIKKFEEHIYRGILKRRSSH